MAKRKKSGTKKKAAKSAKSPVKAKSTKKKTPAAPKKTTAKSKSRAASKKAPAASSAAGADAAAPPPSRPAKKAKPPRPPKPPKPRKPAKPAVDANWIAAMRDMLAQQRRQLLSVVQSSQAQLAEKEGDLPDVSDRASEGFEDELTVGLLAIEAAQLDDIEAAIQRIDDGTYGICEDCLKAIPKKRLEVLPFARRCLTCKGLTERRFPAAETESDDDDWG